MKVFISWSGQRSKFVANELRNWIPDVIQTVEPWMSDNDIEAGARWGRDIEVQLNETKFGIICLTKNNLNNPWILFEAGALAKTIDKTYVCPYLIDLSPSELPQGPLTQFQAKIANEEDTFDIINTICNSMDNNFLTEEQLKRAFDRWWPDLNEQLSNLPARKENIERDRSEIDMLSEILEIVRELNREQKERDDRLNKYIQVLLLNRYYDSHDSVKKKELDNMLVEFFNKQKNKNTHIDIFKKDLFINDNNKNTG